jgi:predicted DCC family thiol-disulfide oxidoreductase YuxK
VLYDAQCALCRRLRVWLDRQPAFVALRFVPFQTENFDERFPGIAELRPDRELIVLSDDGLVWQGSDAWIVCLWALREWREFAQRLANPLLRPLAKKMGRLVSENRHGISQWLRLRSDDELAEALDQIQTPPCEEGGCPR